LSYAQFDYSGLVVRPDGDGLEVSFELRNTGSVKGSEAPQVYVGPPSSPPPSVQFAFKKLAGFERVELGAGEGKRVRIQVSRRELSYWSTALQRWILPGGRAHRIRRGLLAGPALAGESSHTGAAVAGVGGSLPNCARCAAEPLS
jgi:hypothetical protein